MDSLSDLAFWRTVLLILRSNSCLDSMFVKYCPLFPLNSRNKKKAFFSGPACCAGCRYCGIDGPGAETSREVCPSPLSEKPKMTAPKKQILKIISLSFFKTKIPAEIFYGASPIQSLKNTFTKRICPFFISSIFATNNLPKTSSAQIRNGLCNATTGLPEKIHIGKIVFFLQILFRKLRNKRTGATITLNVPACFFATNF